MATAYATKQPPVPTARELGARLRELREREQLTVHDIARRVKMRDQDLERFETKGEIDGDQLVKLIGTISAERSLDGAFEKIAPVELDLESLPGILDAWSAGQIDNREAIRRAKLEDYADLVETAIDNEVALPTRLTAADRAAAARFAGMDF